MYVKAIINHKVINYKLKNGVLECEFSVGSSVIVNIFHLIGTHQRLLVFW